MPKRKLSTDDLMGQFGAKGPKLRRSEESGQFNFKEENFVMGDFLGQGSFGVVYEGLLRVSPGSSLSNQQRQVAVKELSRKTRLDAVRAEFRALRMVGKRLGVVEVFALVRVWDSFFVIMEHLPSERLDKIVQSMTPHHIMIYLYHIFSGLGHTHSLGIVHNDVKPANVVFDRFRNRYLLIDFGLASFADEEPRKKEEGAVTDEQIIPWTPDWREWQTGRDAADRLVDILTTASEFDVLMGESGEMKTASEYITPVLEGKSKMFRMSFLCRWIRLMVESEEDGNIVDLINAQEEDLVELFESMDFLDVEGMELLSQCQSLELPSSADLCKVASCVEISRCRCRGIGQLCTFCDENADYFCRSWGTRGYRAPEVELRIPTRGGGVDVWAMGQILMGMLLKRFPLMLPENHHSAIVQLSQLYGSKSLSQLATANHRRLILPKAEGVDLVKMVFLHECISQPENWPFETDCKRCADFVHENTNGLCICSTFEDPLDSMNETTMKDLFRILRTSTSMLPEDRDCAFELAERCLNSLQRHSTRTTVFPELPTVTRDTVASEDNVENCTEIQKQSSTDAMRARALSNVAELFKHPSSASLIQPSPSLLSRRDSLDSRASLSSQRSSLDSNATIPYVDGVPNLSKRYRRPK